MTPSVSNDTQKQAVTPSVPKNARGSLANQDVDPSDGVNNNSQGTTNTQPNTQDNITYPIDKLLACKTQNGVKYYKVKWTGYSARTWEPAENLPSDLIREFHTSKTQKGKARKKTKKSKLTCFSQ